MTGDQRIPVAEILAKAQEKGWPTSSIDAMANHHLCGHIARDYVNDCFVGHAAGPRSDGQAEARQDAALLGHGGAASASARFEGTLVPTEQQKEQLAALIAERAAKGQSTDAFANLQDLVEGATQLPDEE